MATIVDGTQTSQGAIDRKRALERGHNRPIIEGAWIPREQQYVVYIYTTSKRAFHVEHALLTMDIPACAPAERVKKVRWIPHPWPQKVEDVFGVDREPFDYHSGERIAMDIVSPSNPTLDQRIDDYGRIDAHFAVQDGTNLLQQGVFWSRNDPPTEAEVAAAEARWAKRARFLIQQADKMIAEDPANGMKRLDMQEVRAALDHYGEQRPYHKKMTPMAQCPNCAIEIVATAAFHYLPNGMACINDWERAVDAGVKTRDDVPISKRWWKEKTA